MPALNSGTVPAPGYGVPGNAVAASLPPAVSNNWLKQDANAFKGPVEPVSGPGGDWPQADVPSDGQGAGWEEPELAGTPDGEGYYDPGFSQGPWPWSEAFGEAYGVVPDDGLDTYRYPIANKEFSGRRTWSQAHPGSNLISQQTDNAGWQVNEPSGRTAYRLGINQDYLGVDPFWYDSAAMPSRGKGIMVAQPVNGVIAEYGGVYGAGGNLALNEPQPPATSDVSQAPASQYTLGSDQYWGS